MTPGPAAVDRAGGQAGRLPALDQLRGFAVVLVVLHHSILAYCTFGHIDRAHYPLSTAPIVDARRWAGFDVLVQLNDGALMPLLFLLSGLFVWGGLARKGTGAFLRGRLLRLGLPFAVAVLTAMPLAYYPSYLQAGGIPGFAAFWVRTVMAGPWPSGPPWFIGVLLVFDVAAAGLFRLGWRALPGWARAPGPAWCFAGLLAGSLLFYLPLLEVFGPALWLGVGPWAVQGSRILLYAAYFAAGALLGAHGMGGMAQFGMALAQRWPWWLLLAVAAGAAFVVVGTPHVVVLDGLATWPDLWTTGTALAVSCAAACFGLGAVFMRFGGRPGPVWGSLGANGFGIYLLHYPAVTWTQHALLPAPVGAGAKAAVTLVVALAASWVGAALLRQAPGIGRIV